MPGARSAWPQAGLAGPAGGGGGGVAATWGLTPAAAGTWAAPAAAVSPAHSTAAESTHKTAAIGPERLRMAHPPVSHPDKRTRYERILTSDGALWNLSFPRFGTTG